MKFLISRSAACVLMATGMAGAQDKSASGQPLSDAQSQRVTPTVRVFREVSPAVVNLSTTKVVTVQSPFGGSLFEDIFDFPSFTRPRRYKTHSVGSGFFIHQDGYLITNSHVIDRAAECKVLLANGTELDAEEVAIDRDNDLAILKVNTRKKVPFLKLGRSDDIMQGETVIAIGNPLGYGHTVTTGIVSAVDRELRFSEYHVYSGLIQTDASINPGNSGGPLLNIKGELIGINTAIRGDAQNIGFAIPVERLHDRLPGMLDIERLKRVDFGVYFDGKAGMTQRDGVRVKRVDPGTPGDRAGVRRGDLLVAIDNQPTRTFLDAFSLLERTPRGQSIKLDLVHGSNKTRRSVDLTLAEMPTRDASRIMQRYFGLDVRELNGADLKRLGLRGKIGLIVKSVRRGTEAFRQGMANGDIITRFGGLSVNSLERLSSLLEQVDRDDRIPFQIMRIGGDSFVRFELALKAN